jgi:hypothetical protein
MFKINKEYLQIFLIENHQFKIKNLNFELLLINTKLEDIILYHLQSKSLIIL